MKTFGNVSIRRHEIGVKQLCRYVKGLLIHTRKTPHSSQWLAKLLRRYQFQSIEWNYKYRVIPFIQLLSHYSEIDRLIDEHLGSSPYGPDASRHYRRAFRVPQSVISSGELCSFTFTQIKNFEVLWVQEKEPRYPFSFSLKKS